MFMFFSYHILFDATSCADVRISEFRCLFSLVGSSCHWDKKIKIQSDHFWEVHCLAFQALSIKLSVQHE